MSQHLAKFQEGLHRAKASSLVTDLDQADRERCLSDCFGTGIFTGQGDTTKEAYDMAGLRSMQGWLPTMKRRRGINLLKSWKKSSYQTALAKLHLEEHMEVW